VFGDSPFDRFYFGGDSAAISEPARRGWLLFNSPKVGCGGCHVAVHTDPRGGARALFTDHQFKNLGVGYKNGRMNDVGRYAVTGNPADWGKFRAPTLRNIALTAPYMHDGSLQTLEDVVEFYNRGGIPNPNLDPLMKQLHLSTDEQRNIVAFLRTLTSSVFEDTVALRRALLTPRSGRR
jgi:cytochrome c peroxidase